MHRCAKRGAGGVLLLAAMIAVGSSRAFAGEPAQAGEKKAWDMLTAQPEAIEAWKDMRFGMFNIVVLETTINPLVGEFQLFAARPTPARP